MADESAEPTGGTVRLPKPALLAAAGTFLLFSLVAALAFEPFVRSQVERRAQARGLQVAVEEVDLGWRGVWLKQVSVAAPDMPALKAQLGAVFVPLGDGAIELHGGDVMLTGSYADVSQQWARLRKPEAASPNAQAAGADYLVEGLHFTWSGVSSARDTQRVWGLGYRRSAGRESVSAELVRLFADGASLEVRGLNADLRRLQGARSVSRASAHSALLEVDFTRFGLARPSAGSQANEARGSVSRAAKLPLLLAALTPGLQKAVEENARIEVKAVRARLRSQSDTLNFGPSTLLVERKLGALSAALEPGGKANPDATPLALRAVLPLAGGEPQLELAGGPVSLSVLGVREGDFGLFDVKRASLEANTKLTLTADSGLRLSGSGSLKDLSLSRAALAPQPLRGIRLGWRGSAQAALDGTRFDVSDAELTVGDVRFQGSFVLERGADFLSVKAEGGVPLAACEKLLEAAPQGFAPLLSGLRMNGTFAANFAMDVDTRRLDRMKVALDVKNGCAITHVPEQLLPSRFQAPWWRTVKGVDQQPMTIESGPGSRNWVPYDAISPHMETAVIVCEDGGFFRHGGFDYRAIEKSIQDNVRAGRFLRGASTISMQLAKNLYLGKEKTLSRKFEEALLTMLIEQQFEKRELMELYLNVIEFGPGLYGIGPAARHYFNVEPQKLSLGQALYLASILPSPQHQHFDQSGAVSERWMKYLHKLMYIARKISRVTEEELEAGLAEEVAFRVPGAEPPAFSDELPPMPPEPTPDEEPRNP